MLGQWRGIRPVPCCLTPPGSSLKGHGGTGLHAGLFELDCVAIIPRSDRLSSGDGFVLRF